MTDRKQPIARGDFVIPANPSPLKKNSVWNRWRMTTICSRFTCFNHSSSQVRRTKRSPNSALFLVLYEGGVPTDSNLLAALEVPPHETRANVSFHFRPSSCSKSFYHFCYHHAASPFWVGEIIIRSSPRNRSRSPASTPTRLSASSSSFTTTPPSPVPS